MFINIQLPMFHFLTEAYCSFVNGRLPTEVEWEYVATNLSETIYPWGDQDITDEYGNFFIKFSGTNNVNEYDISNTRLSIKQMIGNCLEYCNSIFKPYDNFCIDVIEDFSNYKHFGKVICKGGSWSSHIINCHPKYRYFVDKNNVLEYIGFRVCK